jgi:hypothetical protein
MKCEERAGFLIPRACPTEATVQCTQCQKWVCGNHTANLTHGGLGCTSCAAAENVGPGANARQIRDYYGYNPGLFSGYGRGWGRLSYTTGDYEVFSSGHHHQGILDTDPNQDLTGS